jgi:two-component system LytT family sensor kinase
VAVLQSLVFAVTMMEHDGRGHGVLADARRSVVHHGAGDLFTYAAIVGVNFAFDTYRKYRDRELVASQLARETSELQALHARARLDALRMQLHPHFFVNTLNTLSALVLKGDQHTAQRVIARLGDLLRVALATSSTQQVSLATELEFADSYLELEQLRLGDRLQIVRDIEPEARRAMVPSLILQPLIENAIRHGIAPRSAAGRLVIDARREDSSLVVRIRDSGAGFVAGAATRGTGVGLENVRARLAALYGDSASLVTANAPEGGAVVTISMPFQRGSVVNPARDDGPARVTVG